MVKAQGEGGGDSRFQVKGRSKGFFGFEIHDFRIFLSKKILAIIFFLVVCNLLE